MRVLLSFESFAGFGGTETYTLTVAKELGRLGHEAAIYSPAQGQMAEQAREDGIKVLGRHELPRSCDLLICSDAATCHELAGRYLESVVIFVVHSADYMLQAPPQLPDACTAVVVLNDRVRRAVEARAWHAPIVRLRQPIDLLRFWNIAPDRPVAGTALVLSNYVDGPRAQLIGRACRDNGLEVIWVGARTASMAAPEHAIARAGLVIGLGRSVLEGMAAGRAAFVYGLLGGDGWVTPDRYPKMEADGFAGTAASELVLDPACLAEELARFDESMGEVNRDLASAHHSARDHAVELVNLARGLDRAPVVEPSLGQELAHLVRLEWQSSGRASAAIAEAELLRSQLAHAQTDIAHLRGAALSANERLEALRATRRYRLACRIAAPLDRLRRRRVRCPRLVNQAMRTNIAPRCRASQSHSTPRSAA